MKRVLLTGLSGVGKSTLVEALAASGVRAVDLDSDRYSHWVDASAVEAAPGTPVEPDRDWVWREEPVQELLDDDSGDVLFASGCAANMGRFLPRFDEVVLLTAPPEVIAERLRSRAPDGYGARPDEVTRVLELVETVEPALRRIAHHELDTTAPLDQVVSRILELARS